jgi:prepilin-type processing-associated H-X9-DG protein
MSRISIYPYVRSTQIFICPSDTIGQKQGESYGLSACVQGKSAAFFQETATKLMLAEERIIGSSGGDSTNDGYFYYDPAPTGTNDRLSQRHLGGSSVLFVDGHVKFQIVPDDDMTKKNILMLGGDSAC